MEKLESGAWNDESRLANQGFCWLLLVAAFVALTGLIAVAVPAAPAQARGAVPDGLQEVTITKLPTEAQETIRLIKRGGPFPYDRDGTVFHNFEKRLPARERGYYREYTVPTPGVRGRGARRIVTGRGGEFYYTDDHYRTFRRVPEKPASGE